ncbi:MAG: deoxyribonuclease IV [Candidatus Bruticola sp.]
MFKIGCHLSISKGLSAMLKDALSINANVIQFFCRNPRGKGALRFKQDDIENFVCQLRQHNFGPMLVHSPFVINPASIEDKVRSLTKEVFIEDLQFTSLLPGAMYNFHPGNYLKRTPEEGIVSIADMLNEVVFDDFPSFVLLETMAGKGTELGRSFEELKAIIDRTTCAEKLGVCLDTCHVWDGGYDMADGLDRTLEQFDRVLGLDKLKAIHLNDSLNIQGAHKDRHAKIGEGRLGIKAIAGIINHPLLRELPFYLETPNVLEGYGEEIKILRSLYEA